MKLVFRLKVSFIALLLLAFYFLSLRLFPTGLRNSQLFESIKDNHEKVNCVPRLNIVFVKTHKTASTTVQNVVIRKGLELGAIFVLPRKYNIISQKHRFRATFVTKPTNFSYNILAHHARFNYKEMKKIMPNDTIFVTILRHPLDQFESMFSYYYLQEHYHVPFQEFTADSKLTNLRTRFDGFLGINQMLFDLGFNGQTRDPDALDQYINRLDSQFHLVLIAEKMEESLILLKNILCWSLSDVRFFKLNARSKRSNFSDAVTRMVSSVNFADAKLYNHFLNKHYSQVEAYGADKMKQEVTELKLRNQNMFTKCQSEKKSKTIQAGSKCWLMTRSEMQLTQFLVDHQQQKYPNIRAPN